MLMKMFGRITCKLAITACLLGGISDLFAQIPTTQRSIRRAQPTKFAEPKIGQQESILLIGNSYTYFNSMGLMLNAMLEKQGVSMKVGQQCIDAGQLQSHASNEETLARLSGQKWKFVVLQEQSDTPTADPEAMITAGKALCKKIRDAQGTPVLFVTWAKKEAAENQNIAKEQQDNISTSYVKLAKETKARLAPVGPAWLLCNKKYPQYALHQEDGSHPTKLGSYLTACVLFRSITGKSPVGLPAKIIVGNATICNLPYEQARHLQQIAEEACKSFSPAAILKKAEQKDKEASNPSQD